MKLSKALKQKNKLAQDVQAYKLTLAKVNSHPVKQNVDHDAREVLGELRKSLDELVAVKTAIAVSNTSVYGKIFRLAELKGLAATLKGLETKSGTFNEGGGFGSTTVEVEYIAQFNAIEVEKLVEEIETEITSLQDELDEFNAATEAVTV